MLVYQRVKSKPFLVSDTLRLRPEAPLRRQSDHQRGDGWSDVSLYHIGHTHVYIYLLYIYDNRIQYNIIWYDNIYIYIYHYKHTYTLLIYTDILYIYIYTVYQFHIQCTSVYIPFPRKKRGKKTRSHITGPGGMWRICPTKCDPTFGEGCYQGFPSTPW